MYCHLTIISESHSNAKFHAEAFYMILGVRFNKLILLSIIHNCLFVNTIIMLINNFAALRAMPIFQDFFSHQSLVFYLLKLKQQ